MAQKPDDLDAVRTVVQSLSGFDADTQERVLRWAGEKLGLAARDVQGAPVAEQHGTPAKREHPPAAGTPAASPRGRTQASDIKSFVAQKNPSSNNEFTATVAYYYRFECPEADRKDAITADDLQEACRLAGRNRLAKPAQALVHAHHAGLIDKSGDRGAYCISTVGENLVAMTLPKDGSTPRTASPRRRTGKPKKKAAKKATRKKTKKKRS